MKVLFMGLGSIGRRHIKNLAKLCGERGLPLEVTALRATGTPLPPEVAALVAHECTSLTEDDVFDVAFITNPTHLHAMAVGSLKGRAKALFIEKPIFDHPGYDLAVLGLGPGVRAYVAAPLRHTALYAALKRALDDGCRPYSARVICSSYLPEWRPGTDYRAHYSAHAAQGGGVTLDLIHEWDYLYGLFGPPLECHNLRGHYSALELDSDDVSVYIARWERLLGEVHLDYFGRGYRRSIELLCEAGSLVADFGTGALTLPDGTVQSHAEDNNDRFLREMTYFLDYLQGEESESISSPARALEVLKIAVGACE